MIILTHAAFPVGATGMGRVDELRTFELTGKLEVRIAELNHGSFAVEEKKTPCVEAL